ncbi:hypothetical protein ACJX0J_028002, partial [Zea mays]
YAIGIARRGVGKTNLGITIVVLKLLVSTRFFFYFATIFFLLTITTPGTWLALEDISEGVDNNVNNKNLIITFTCYSSKKNLFKTKGIQNKINNNIIFEQINKSVPWGHLRIISFVDELRNDIVFFWRFLKLVMDNMAEKKTEMINIIQNCAAIAPPGLQMILISR